MRLYQSFERFQQFDDNHVDFGEKISKLGSAAAKRTGPRSGQWNVAVHVPLVNKNEKQKKTVPKQEVKRWTSTANGGGYASRRGGGEEEAVLKSRAPEAQVIKIQNKLAHRYTTHLPPETTLKQAQVCLGESPLCSTPLPTYLCAGVTPTLRFRFLDSLYWNSLNWALSSSICASQRWHTWASQAHRTIHCA